MKTLEKFVNDINNAIISEQKNKELKFKKTLKTILETNEPDPEDVVGQDADDNDTGGVYGISEPVDDEAIKNIDLNSPDNTKSMQALIDKFDVPEDFFISGRAGWGKTSVIETLAAKYKRTVITVYLDKAEATDLGGIPYIGKNKQGNGVQHNALPRWADYMKQRPKEQFLLFFDEMNQATTDVMNALMPIVLKHEICGYKFKNFFVGAAGNLEEENPGGVNELAGPLKSRFKPIIKWETHTPKAWKSAFKFLHSKWDNKIGKDVVDKLEENAECFDNPREIDLKVLNYVYAIKQNNDSRQRSNVEKIYDRLEGLAAEDLERHQKAELQKLAEFLYNNIVAGDGAAEKAGRASRKDIEMTPSNLRDSIKNAMQFGFIAQKENGKQVKYGISRENIGVILELCEDDSLNPEIFNRLLNKFEADGVKYKFETNEGWKKAGYKDPYED